jgi:NADH:ubiquinone oxidoreductase subunit E
MSEFTRPKARYRVVLCLGEYCNLGRRADKLYKALQPLIAGRNEGQLCAKLETARCLSMCGRGPNLVIYPQDAVFNKVEERDLASIIDQQLQCSKVQDHE